MPDDLRRDLSARADRGEPRGADAVLAAARSGWRPAGRRHRSMLAMVAAVVVVALAAVSIVVARAPEGDGSGEEAAPGKPTTTTGEEPVVAQSASSLVRFDDCGALLAELRARALDHVGPSGLPGLGWHGWMDGDVFSRRGPYLEQGGVPSAANGALSTNTQEAGVDEPDLVESDGQRLFIVRAGVLRVVDTASATVTHTVPLGVVNVIGAMLVDDTLVVLADEPLVAARAETVVVTVDVTGAPVVRERLTATGSLVDARVASGRAHVVVRSSPTIAFTYPSTGGSADTEAATEANRERIKASTIDDWLPHWSVSVGRTAMPTDRMVACDDVRHPKTFAGFEQTTLVTLDLDDLAASQTTAVTAASQTVYGSEESVYVATTSFAGLVTDQPGPGGTDVHRFALGEVPTYAASGRVEGYVAGQLGFSEHQGRLRVASTTYDGTSDTRVTMLAERDGELVTTGAVTGLGRGEDIKGVRFIGDVGYVVTFRQTDPLFVVDLSDPVTPRLAGALSVPGYSAYLHPVGEALVLGVGFDGTDAGGLTGGAVSLFDVRDPAAPTRVGLHGLGRYSAPVLVDDGHHAFTWSEERRTAYVPTGRLESGMFRGSVEVLSVTDGTLAPIGRIEPSGDGSTPQARFDRVVVVDDRVYSVAPEGVQVSDLATLAPITWVPLG